MRFSIEALERSVTDLPRAGASDYFKVYLVLKRHGLGSTPGSPVVVDTQNTLPALNDLFLIRKLEDLNNSGGRPFYVPFTNEMMMNHAPRSIIQTHVKHFHDGAVPGGIVVPWLHCEQLPDGKWQVAVSQDYPKGLGTGRNGLADSEDRQISIPTAAFLAWYFRYQEFKQKPTFTQLFQQLQVEMNFDDAELTLLFDDQRNLDGFEVSDKPLNEEKFAQFIADRAAQGSEAITAALKNKTPGRPKFSDRRINAVVQTFKEISEPNTEWFSCRDELQEALAILKTKKVLLLVGPPAVGKTRLAFQVANTVLNGDELRLHKFQFHASYSYEDFVEALVPKPTEGQLQFEVEAKGFLKACEAALTSPQVVLIDELNRADVAKVFGEAILQLEPEYRKPKYAVKRTYKPGTTFYVPENLYLIATMNNIDKSTFDIDFAVLRRFGQLDLKPDPVALAKMLREDNCTDEQLIRILCTLLSEVQQFYPLGHGYFKGVKTKDDLPLIYRRSIRPVVKSYLGEDRHDDLGNVDKIFEKAYRSATWEQFVGEVSE